MSSPKFTSFAPPVTPQSPLRRAITAAYRRGEPECLAPLLDAASLPEAVAGAARDMARSLITALRAKKRTGGVEGLVQEYALSSQEGVALMCLAEALLRIPDAATRDALIRDKIAEGDWKSHVGGEKSLFVNAASWGLVVTGKLVENSDSKSLSNSLTRLIARTGEPVIRRGVDLAMRMMGEQFVTGQTIDKALKRSRKMEAKGFAYSYDMLGEAATTAADAARYYDDYERAIHAIGKASVGRGVYAGPGISIKLSALHPRYSRAQADRVMGELLPRVKALMVLARSYDIGVNIDAEEADRLELSLDLLEALALDADLAGWNGLGFVVQAYGKRCPFVIDWLIDLAHRADRRIMVRLVKGAYWDAEIKRTQEAGLVDFPVYTRKVHTDISYVACAKKLLAARGVIFPQFATHNAQTLATIYQMAGPDFAIGDWEFQCLHGMGEPLYSEVVGVEKYGRPCRVYAPVGTHETLLGYLVRRLLENGANSSFVNRIGDPAVPVEELIVDPVELVRAEAMPGARHELISLPADIFGGRKNSAGIDLSDENSLKDLSKALLSSTQQIWQAGPLISGLPDAVRPVEEVVNPADRQDVVGKVTLSNPEDAAHAAQQAVAAVAKWSATLVEQRADILRRAADALQVKMPVLLGLIVREAGKSLPNAIAEVREAIDFLRYYADQAVAQFNGKTQPLGPIVCISPWNFPLAIFMGQIAAALVAGNSVLAKPAEQTPLIAAEGVRLLHDAGVPADVLHYVPGDGAIGAALVAAPETAGVMFTGSTEVARLIQKQLATRVSAQGKPVPFIAETGGQNAMIVDSSALAEQVVADVIASAFDSAGQRCSALRVLCIQEEAADHVLSMLKGAFRELRIGSTDRLAVDIGPVITAEAKADIENHIELLRVRGCPVEQAPMLPEAAQGHFVAPTIIELDSIDELDREIFGPVLHVIRYARDDLDALIDTINATGYGLTFGLHTRLDDMVDHVTSRIGAGNIYVNRNVIGAVVGVQPFGGRGLSGTGPKAGGPLYLRRLVANPSLLPARADAQVDSALRDFAQWLEAQGEAEAASLTHQLGVSTPLGMVADLSGPVGEKNSYALHRRGTIMLRPVSRAGLFHQLAAVLATGNDFVLEADNALIALVADMPNNVRLRLQTTTDAIAGALIEGDAPVTIAALKALADRLPNVVIAQAAPSKEMLKPATYRLEWLIEEVSTSVNTTAAGGNASLMALV
ncbi:MAG: trifunctional transcriptional regulator/proline dehydrogenase/L-glutamate gamma-semialdehyde dehydrogenase [Sphingobium sp.]|nr:trifunctional transcriptional regulator/proline dehydrogenase/L-glutamate gamma-semialdehyde dehydrogenase [Sphingobium sp.]